MNKQKVVVVIPTHKDELDFDEKISLRRCLAVLAEHPIQIICPCSLNTEYYQQFLSDTVTLRRVPDNWLSSKQAYNRLKVSSKFYQMFQEFEFLLTYELDSYVFTDSVLQWCNSGYDYIGAPWFRGYSKPEQPPQFLGVGNSGFSLRRVSSCSKVVKTYKFLESPKLILKNICRQIVNRKFVLAKRKLMQLLLGNNFNSVLNCKYDHNEDIFWGLVAPKHFKSFRVPSPETAIGFSFEVLPRLLYEMNQRKLPFGCHAWTRYDPEFWLEFIEKV